MPTKLRIEGNLPIYNILSTKNPRANNNQWGKTECFLSMISQSALTNLFNMVVEVLGSVIRQENKIKGTQDQKEEIVPIWRKSQGNYKKILKNIKFT